MTSLDRDQTAVDEIAPYLDPGEKILWAAKPKQGFVLRREDLFIVPFSLVWSGSAFVGSGAVLERGIDSLFDLIPLLFVAIGLYLLAGRFVHDILDRSATSYALTDKRVLIRTGFFKPHTRSFQLRSLPELGLSEWSSGRGSITIGDSERQFGRLPGSDDNELFGIENAVAVNRAIRNQADR
ncbi:MAG: PH domain-containing protein [Minwuia sp.]|uniref:PH domain-containing protein n=1 Tax=Minwuia sp. TaxID=2493630 RepID=UPI003A8492F1